MENDLNLERCV